MEAKLEIEPIGVQARCLLIILYERTVDLCSYL